MPNNRIKSGNGKTCRNAWFFNEELPSFPALENNLKADVCIVGGGITGLTCAYLLAQEKQSVVLLDAGKLGGGESSRTTAHLTNAVDGGYRNIVSLHGLGRARLLAQSHTAAIGKIEKIISDTGIKCDFEQVNGYLFSPTSSWTGSLSDEYEAAMHVGVADIEKVDRAPIDSFDTGPAIRFGKQAQFHPLKYLQGLIQAAQHKGVKIFEHSHVQKVEGGDKSRVWLSNKNYVACGSIVIATHSPFNDWVVIHTKQAAYRTYAVAALVPQNYISHNLYWDQQEPYHFVRTQQVSPGSDLLIIGGEDHKTGQADDPDKRYARLEKWGRERFPLMGTIDFRWSGQVLEPVDNLAFIGRNPSDYKNVYVGTGYSGTGMTYGTIAGMLINDLIARRKNAWEKLYDPSRKTLAAVGNFARENLNVLFQYMDWVMPSQVSSIKKIPRGSGAVIRNGLEMLAVYRDENNVCHVHSAACPHLGGVVAWNSSEKSWDCPCHGSRFNPLGQVIHGPASTDLASATLPGRLPVKYTKKIKVRNYTHKGGHGAPAASA